MKKLILFICLSLAFALSLTGCELNPVEVETDDENDFRIISQEEAMEMLSRDDGHIVIDVRTRDEFNEGHIPGAICIPNEDIGDERPAELPELEQIILVYCRSGNRSKKAAKKLCDMGYKNVYEFGGIITWEGDTVKPGTEAKLTFSSFDGGGPEYSVFFADESIASYTGERRYGNENHEEIDGASYDVVFTFSGLKQGETRMTVEERSPIAGNFDHFYVLKVDEKLNVTIELTGSVDLDEAISPTAVLVIETENGYYTAIPEDNLSAREFIDQLKDGPIALVLQDFGGFEKVGDLPWEVTRNDSEITAGPGDVILYNGNKLSILYDENTWSMTKLASITDVTREELLEAFGDGEVTVTLWAEWGE